MAITIQKARPEDAQAILEYLKMIGGESDNLSFGSEGMGIPVEAEIQYLESMEKSETAIMLAAKDGDRIVGTASFSAYPRERMKHRGEISVSVLKAYWGNGVGTRLMEQVIDFAKYAGMEIISLEVRSDNARAIRLYEKLGFEKIGVFKGFFKIGKELIDFDLMNLYL